MIWGLPEKKDYLKASLLSVFFFFFTLEEEEIFMWFLSLKLYLWFSDDSFVAIENLEQVSPCRLQNFK